MGDVAPGRGPGRAHPRLRRDLRPEPAGGVAPDLVEAALDPRLHDGHRRGLRGRIRAGGERPRGARRRFGAAARGDPRSARAARSRRAARQDRPHDLGTAAPRSVYPRYVASTKGTSMRRLIVLAALATLATLAATAPAAAKGPSTASITGPGLDHGLPIKGEGESGPGTPLGSLVQFGGFFAQVFDQIPDPTTRAQPTADLGPRYQVVYRV